MSATSTHDRSETIRARVRDDYTAALEAARRGTGGCCGATPPPRPAEAGTGDAGPTGCCSGAGDVGARAGAAATSFGCGNPLALAGIGPGDTVLDLGSGAGFDVVVAAGMVAPGGRVIGIDMTDAMVAAARDNVRRAGVDNVEIRRGTIEALPVDDASADWVVSNCVINLSPEKDRVFREIHRVLRPGGRISIADIVARGLPEALRDDAAAHSACIAGAVTEEEYVAGLAEAGLVDVTVDERRILGLRELGDALGDAGEWGHDLGGRAEVASIRVRGRKPGGPQARARP